jgi:hypothetical protein
VADDPFGDHHGQRNQYWRTVQMSSRELANFRVLNADPTPHARSPSIRELEHEAAID